MNFNRAAFAECRKYLAILILLFVACLNCVGCKNLKTSASFMVETEPAKAKIYLNGKYVGRSPCKVVVRDKGSSDHWERHKIEAQLAGYELQDYEVTYRTGAAWVPSPIKLDLTKSKSFKRLEGSKEIAVNQTVKKNNKTIIIKNDSDKKNKLVPNEAKKEISTDKIAKKDPDKKIADSKNSEKSTRKIIKKIKPADKLNDNQNFICELRLVRVEDGKVMTQQSAMASVGNARKLAAVLIDKIIRHLPEDDIPIAAICLCNRRRSSEGQRLSIIMSQQVEAALLKTDQFDRVVSVNLRSLIDNELKLENAKTMSDSTYESLLDGAQYMIIGGVALQKKPSSLNEKDTHYGTVKKTR